MLNFKTTIEKKICSSCRETYDEEVVWFLGKPCQDDPSLCEECVRQKKGDNDRLNTINKAKNKYEKLIPPTIRATDINHDSFNKTLLQHTQAWIKAELKSNSKRWLGLVGDTGKCKTRCLALMVKTLLWHGKKVAWCKSKKFQEASQNVWANGSEELRKLSRESRKNLDMWKKVEVLVIDDIGKNRFTDNVESELFDLLDERSEAGLMTLWSANTHPHDMIKRFNLSDDRGKPLVGRLLDFSEIVNT